MELTGNKGEWSELYVLFKLLGEKKIHAGDGNLNKLNIYYPVLKILREELERHMEYSLDKDIVIVTEDGNEISRINVCEFLSQSKTLFSEIQNGGSGRGAFKIPSQEEFLKKIHCRKIKAKSQDKSDIHIVIHDYHTGMQPNLGFSIKSDAGANPTLLNASAATGFVYKVGGKKMNNDLAGSINAIVGGRKIQDRVNKIYDSQCNLEYNSVENDVFYNNLCMIDSNLPKIIAWMMADCYKNRDMNIKRAVERITKINPLGYNLTKGHDFYGYKIKSLMVASALGMLPAKTWSGQLEATGGYIIVKNDGDVICFHLYDRNLLEDYLFQNTKFETPTGERYNLGQIYCNSEKQYFFNLNLQIRFN
jgi:hypothetical protein